MWSRPSTTIVSTTQASTCSSFSTAFFRGPEESDPELPTAIYAQSRQTPMRSSR
jgi:hypothetical protein